MTAAQRFQHLLKALEVQANFQAGVLHRDPHIVDVWPNVGIDESQDGGRHQECVQIGVVYDQERLHRPSA